MRIWVSLPALALALSALGVLPASSVQAAASVPADTTASLPITSFGRIVADTAHGHLFLSSSSQNEILVTDLTGQPVATITGQDGVRGLALSPDSSTLYAALASSQAVTAIDTATLQQTASYPLGSGNTPRDVAVQSGKVWVSYNESGAYQGAIGDIDLSAGNPTFQAQAAMGEWYSAPDLAADPQDTGVLIAAQPGADPSTVASFSVSADPPTAAVQPTRFENCAFEEDLAVVPGGSEFIMACDSPDNHYRYSTADLSQQMSYTSTINPDAVAMDTNGDVAAGSDSWYTPDLYIYDASGNTRLNTYDLGGANTNTVLAARGLAWMPDGSQLFAVLRTISGNPTDTYSLRVLGKPTFRQSALTLTGPSTAGITKPVTLKGSLTLGGVAAPAGTAVTVKRTVSGGADQTFSLTTAADGSYSLTDTPPALGQYTYTASYNSSDPNTASSTATQTVNVTLVPSALTMNGPSTAGITQPVTLTGALTVDGTAPPAGTAITVTRTVSGGADKSFELTTAADGSYSLTDTPPALGQYTYTASYNSSDPNTASSTATQTVNVTLIPTSLTVSTGATVYTYQPTITITANLGTTDSNRMVSIYAQPAGGSKKLLKTGTVDASGNLTVSYPAPHNTRFSAVFTGDQYYAPETVTQDVNVRAKVSESISGYYGKTSIGGTTYRLYHHTALLKAAATVTPRQSGQCVQFEVQEYYQGAWQPNVKTGCKSLSSTSKAAASFRLTKADLGYHYRVRADFLGSLTNAGNSSAWQYLIVKK